MLLIYSALPVGGIETFFCRLAKERFNNKLTTSILLLSKEKESNQELLLEIQKYCKVYFYKDLFKNLSFLGPIELSRSGMPLIIPMYKEVLSGVLKSASQIHVTNGVCALLAKRMLNLTGLQIPITVGVYHSQEFTWGKKLPYFERINRRFVLGTINSKNLFCFYQSTKDYIKAKTGFPIESAKTFRLGVVSNTEKYRCTLNASPKRLRICMIGRLVDFKKYNVWMPEVVSELNQMGYDVSLDIYGDGPFLSQIKKKIVDIAIEHKVSLKGLLNYSSFDVVASTYDLFVGSGTAIIQAASLGVPSVIGIESNMNSTTYGFFSDFYREEYHHPDLGHKKINVKDLLASYIDSDIQYKEQLSKRHIDAAYLFSMNLCVKNFEIDLLANTPSFRYSKMRYIASKFFSALWFKISKRTIYEKLS